MVSDIAAINSEWARKHEDGSVDRDSALSYFGRALLSSMICSWWGDWRARATPDPIDGELKDAIARVGQDYLPVGSLAEWMTSYGRDGAGLGTVALGQWRAVWHSEKRRNKACWLRPWERGASVSRPTLPDQYRLGRMLFKKLLPMTGIRDPEGSWVDEPLRG